MEEVNTIVGKIAGMKPPQFEASFFPPVERAMTEPNGLLAMGGDLTMTRLLDAYRHGIFPWFNPGERAPVPYGHASTGRAGRGGELQRQAQIGGGYFGGHDPD